MPVLQPRVSRTPVGSSLSLRPLIAVVVALVLFGSACSSSSDSAEDDAPTTSESTGTTEPGANGPDLNATVVSVGDEELSQIGLRNFLVEWAQLNSGSEEITPEIAISGIEFWVQVTALGQEMAEELTDEDVTVGREWLAEYVPQVQAGNPVHDLLETWWATRLAVGRGEGVDTVVTEQQMRDQLVDINEVQPETVCSSHVLVATEAEAADVLARLDAGESFGDVAAEVSTDVGSGANSGSLGCVPEGQFVEPFENAVWAGTEGELLGPVESEFGFHIILHEGFTRASFEYDDVKGDLRQAVIDLRFRPVDLIHEGRAQDAANAADIVIDPELGSWDPVTSSLLPAA